jgi:hypothetical protein
MSRKAGDGHLGFNNAGNSNASERFACLMVLMRVIKRFPSPASKKSFDATLARYMRWEEAKPNHPCPVGFMSLVLRAPFRCDVSTHKLLLLNFVYTAHQHLGVR